MKKQLPFKFSWSLFQEMHFRMSAYVVLFLFAAQTSFAQQWPYLGNETTLSSIASTHTSVAVVTESGNDIPYVAFCENGVPKVKKRLTDGTWTQVGANLGTSASFTRIFADAAGSLYVAYIDASASSKLAIKKYDSGTATWIPLNNDSNNLYVSTATANGVNSSFPSTQRCSMAFDSSNTPYVAFSDGSSCVPYVKKFNGTAWVAAVGTGAVPLASGFTAAVSQSLAFGSDGTLWLAQTNLATSAATTGTIALYSFDGTTWTERVNSTPIASVRQTCMALNAAGNPTVVYFNANSGATNRATVIEYNKTTSTWPAGFGTYIANRDSPYLSLISDSAGNLYCSFIDQTSGTAVFPMRVRYLAAGTTTWTELKDPAVVRGVDEPATWPAIAVANGSTIPFITYTKANLAANVSTPIVRKYVSQVDPAPGITSFTPAFTATTPAPSVAFTITGTNFTGATAVSFGGNPVTSFTVANATSITGTTSASAVANISVSVTTPNGTATVTGTAPSALTYASVPSTYNGNPLFSTVTATSTLIYSVSPTLPAGLSINTGTGTISGTATAVTASTTYTITATNNYGNTTATVTFATAATTTWSGTAWSNGTPSSSLHAIINGTYSTTTNGAFTSLILTVNAGKAMTINTGTNVTVQNEVINNGSLVVENNANLIQVNNTTNTGNVVVNRNSNALSRLDYTMWSSPVASQNLAAFSPLTSQSPSRFYTYDGPNNVYAAVAAPTATNFAAGTGYLIRMPNTAAAYPTTQTFAGVFTGVPNNGTVSLTGLTANKFYAVGNPYPSVVSADLFLNGNSTAGTLYFWRKTNGIANTGSSYATYTLAGGAGTAAPGNAANDILPNGKIQVGQGFIVKTGAAATSLQFTNAMREAAPTSTQFFKIKETAKDTEKSRIWLNLTSGETFSQALVAYMDGATEGVDNGIDGKYINDSQVALTSNIDGEEYTIQGRPAFDASDIVPLNFKTDKAGEYTIAIDHTDGLFAKGQNVYLVDSVTGAETNLTKEAYTFTAESGTTNSRFTLKYESSSKVVGSPVFNENTVTVYKNNGTLYVDSAASTIVNIKVFNIQGRLIAELKGVNANTAAIKNLKATQQVVIVQVTSEDKKVVTKKVVN